MKAANNLMEFERIIRNSSPLSKRFRYLIRHKYANGAILLILNLKIILILINTIDKIQIQIRLQIQIQLQTRLGGDYKHDAL